MMWCTYNPRQEPITAGKYKVLPHSSCLETPHWTVRKLLYLSVSMCNAQLHRQMSEVDELKP